MQAEGSASVLHACTARLSNSVSVSPKLPRQPNLRREYANHMIHQQQVFTLVSFSEPCKLAVILHAFHNYSHQ